MPRTTSPWIRASGIVAACIFAGVAPASAGTGRHDQPQGFLDNVNYGDQFHMVGGVQMDFSSFGSGVLIEKNWVLTAAHVVAGYTPGSYIKFETDPDPAELEDPGYDPDDWSTLPLSGLFRVEALAIHEHYDDTIGPAGGFDIALLRLDAAAPHTHPDYQPYRRYAGTDEIGQIATPVGFGALGDGNTGFIAESAAFFRVAGDNYIDAYATHSSIVHEFVARPDVINPATNQPYTREEIASQFMLSDFDDPGNLDGLNILGDAQPLPLEYSVAPGDSGGPALFRVYDEETDTFEWTVAGLNSFIYGPPPELGGDGTDNASYSDLQGYLRVSLFNDWIDSVLASTGELTLLPTTGSPIPEELRLADPRLPEPSAAMLLLPALLVLRRRQKA